MTVRGQLAFDLDPRVRLAEALCDRRRIGRGAERLLAALVARGLDERALFAAAALAAELDRPAESTVQQNARGGAVTPTSGQSPHHRKDHQHATFTG